MHDKRFERDLDFQQRLDEKESVVQATSVFATGKQRMSIPVILIVNIPIGNNRRNEKQVSTKRRFSKIIKFAKAI